MFYQALTVIEMASQQIMVSILMPLVAVAGLIAIIFAEKIAGFVNKFDPLKVGYGKNYFRLLGIVMILLSVVFWFILYNMPAGGY